MTNDYIIIDTNLWTESIEMIKAEKKKKKKGKQPNTPAAYSMIWLVDIV